MKKITYHVCILCAVFMTCFGLIGCKNKCHEPDPILEPIPEPVDTLVFGFTLTCSEDFLDYITPVATYIDEHNVEQKIEILKSAFSLFPNNEGDESQPVLYSWKKEIKLANTLTGQRDMQVSYQKKVDAPTIDDEKIYIMCHWLYSEKILKRKDGKTEATIDVKIQNKNRQDVQGKNLPQYFEYIEKNPEYAKEEAK